MKSRVILLCLALIIVFSLIKEVESAASCLYYLYLRQCSNDNVGTHCHHDYYYNTSYDSNNSSSYPCIKREYMTSFCIEYGEKDADVQDDVKCYACEDLYLT